MENNQWTYRYIIPEINYLDKSDLSLYLSLYIYLRYQNKIYHLTELSKQRQMLISLERKTTELSDELRIKGKRIENGKIMGLLFLSL